MRKVLIIAYSYPPQGWSGVQRTVKFVRYLPIFCWEPLVLTPKEWYLPCVMDSEMSREVEHALVERTSMFTHEDFMRLWSGLGLALSPFLRLVGKNADWLAEGMRWRYIKWLCPDYACGWILPAVRMGLKMIRQHKPSIIYATAPPWSDLVIALVLSRLTGIGFVADFRDLWMSNFDKRPAAKWRSWIDPKLERAVISKAAKVICTTESGSRTMSKQHPCVCPDRFITIFNGYDTSDISFPAQGKRDRTQMMICHIGSLYGKRTPAYFLRALEAMLLEKPALRSKLRVRFVGQIDEYASELRGSSCSEMIETTGAVGHAQVAGYLCSADLLLLIMEEGAELVIPGKLFEYLASNRPILAFVPLQSEVAGLLHRAGGATVVDVKDIGRAKEALNEFYGEWLDGRLPRIDREDFVSQFERRELTRRLAEVLEECVKRGNKV